MASSILRAIERLKAMTGESCEINEEIAGAAADAELQMIDEMLSNELIAEVTAKMTAREREAFLIHFGDPDIPVRQIGALMHPPVSGSYVCVVLKRARAKAKLCEGIIKLERVE